MKRLLYAVCLFPLAAVAAAAEPELIADGAEVKLLAEEFAFTEGPASDALGNVYFTDQPNDRILRWSTDEELSTFMQPCGRSNGLCFDSEGHLWACADAKNELWRISPSGDSAAVVKAFESKLLNGPNDLWIDPQNGIYFTDPFYKRPYWNRGPQEQPVQGVYYLKPERSLVRVIDDLKTPNGIIGTPDGKILYVADLGDKKTYAYRIGEGGALSDKRLFCAMGSDGMTIDDRGNVYFTGKGVTVFNPQGEQIAQIAVDAPWTANVCFGGRQGNILFITASKGFYSLQMNVHGVGSQ